jgi:hypothetical protein
MQHNLTFSGASVDDILTYASTSYMNDTIKTYSQLLIQSLQKYDKRIWNSKQKFQFSFKILR